MIRVIVWYKTKTFVIKIQNRLLKKVVMGLPDLQIVVDQCVTNIEFSNEYEYKYIRDVNFGTNTNTNIFIC